MVSTTILSREVGALVSKPDQRWRIDAGPPRYDSYPEAERAVAKQNRNPHLARHLPGLPGPDSWE